MLKLLLKLLSGQDFALLHLAVEVAEVQVKNGSQEARKRYGLLRCGGLALESDEAGVGVGGHDFVTNCLLTTILMDKYKQ